MNIILACEESQEVCKAMRSKGHNAYSCDILPASGGHPEWHIRGDIFDVIENFGLKWDMMIAFPPCTYLCSSGLHWNKRIPERAALTEEALTFVHRLLSLNIPKIVLENSVGCISTRIRPLDQIIQPYNFGEDASKQTCLWLKGVPNLINTSYFPPRIVQDGPYKGKKRWSNQTDSGQNKLGPSADRGLLRSKTYPGIASAMAGQWG